LVLGDYVAAAFQVLDGFALREFGTSLEALVGY